MKQDTLEILCNPATKGPLLLTNDNTGKGELNALMDPIFGQIYPIRNGIPVFVDEQAVTGENKRYRGLYNRTTRFYKLSTRLYACFKGSGEKKRCLEYLSELEIKDGDRVLEVSVGTGANIRYLPRTAHYYGLDLSWSMLQQCRKDLQRTGLAIELFYGVAEALPFKNEVFDVVFHVGGINYFTNKAKVLQEMVRVAKPGTKIIVVDDTEEPAYRYEHTPGVSGFCRTPKDKITAPVELLPPCIDDVKLHTVAKGDLYCLSFRKPS